MFRKLCRLTCKYYIFREYADAQKTIGFVGLGNMGGRLVEKLMNKGTKVMVYDKKVARLEEIKKKGALVASSAADLASKNDIIFTILPSYSAISRVCDGKDGIMAGAKPGLLVVDMSTIGPVNAIRLEYVLKDKKIDFLAAPVSGSTYSIDENIIFLVGGDKKFVDKVDPYLQQMGDANKKNVVHIGDDVSDGQAARICGVLLLACTLVGTSEVMNLGIRLGLNPVILKDALSLTSARCWACQFYNPVPNVLKDSPATANYKPGFSVGTYVGVLAVAQDLAAKIHSPIPLGSLACQIFNIASIRGYNKKDISVVYKLFKQTLLIEE